MCSLFRWQRMEKDQGDLADIVRASGGGGGGGGSCDSTNNNHIISTDWQFPSEPIKFPSVIEEPIDNFGDPFSLIQDPLLHELDLTSSAFFDSSNSLGDHDRGLVEMNVEDDPTTTSNNSSSSCHSLLAQRILDEEMKRPCNFFSRILQISPNTKMPISPRDISTAVATTTVVSSPRGMSTTASSSSLVINDQHHHHMGKASSSSTGCSVDNSSTGMQIPLSRSPAAGIKRRKSQAKKVVCIPAPAAVNSRPSGEVVPSDLWAWRKYGQKPIKGSPYPRGYYRCSSSKGCSARKQVERSRTDPNMLVITYTSEHNHPWPTQRNALAGSTRSQPMKSTTTTTNAAAAGSKRSQSSHQTSSKPTNSVLKEEHKEKSNEINASIAMIPGGSTTSTTSSSIKEEMEETEEKTSMDIYCDGDHQFSTQGFHDHYGQYSVLPAGTGEDMINHADDFFADLGELEPDPLINHLLFSSQLGGSGFEEGNKSDDIDNLKMKENKVALADPFSLFDWTDNNNNNNNTSTFEESSRRGL